MSVLAVIVAIIEDGKILLTKREDFEVWCLPGGGVEDGESVAEAGSLGYGCGHVLALVTIKAKRGGSEPLPFVPAWRCLTRPPLLLRHRRSRHNCRKPFR